MGSSRQPISTGTHTLFGLCLIALAYLAGVAVSQHQASAQYPLEDPPIYTSLNCRYPPDRINPISYRFFGVHPTLRTAFRRGAELWNNTSAPGSFREGSLFLFDPEINVVDKYATGRSRYYWARMYYSCTPNGTWDGDEVKIEFNLRYRTLRTLQDWTFTAAHELGHAYGLGHTKKI